MKQMTLLLLLGMVCLGARAQDLDTVEDISDNSFQIGDQVSLVDKSTVCRNPEILKIGHVFEVNREAFRGQVPTRHFETCFRMGSSLDYKITELVIESKIEVKEILQSDCMIPPEPIVPRVEFCQHYPEYLITPVEIESCHPGLEQCVTFYVKAKDLRKGVFNRILQRGRERVRRIQLPVQD